MTNAELIAKIKAEIERLKDEYTDIAIDSHYGTVNANHVVDDLVQLLSFLSDLEKSLPAKVADDERLEIEIERVVAEYSEKVQGTRVMKPSGVEKIARRFYDLGCRRTAEKYDEIEYNRQRAEEQGSKGLEEEIIKCWQEWVSPSNKQSVEGVLPLSEFAFYARHFAEFGAEHLANARKMSPNDLEEAADEYEKKHTHQRYDGGGLTPEYDATLAEAVIFGAKWQKEQDDKDLSEKIAAAYQLGLADKEKQMLKEAVEGEVFFNPYPTISLDDCKDYDFKDGDRVRVIIVKKD